MSTTVTGSPKGALANAIFVALKADQNLRDLVGGSTPRIYDDPPRGAAVTFPYIVIGERGAETNSGAMQLEGADVRVTVHTWSQARGAALEVEPIQSRMRAILQRANLPVQGFSLIAGSLICDSELCFPDRDEDMPDKSLYHGVQQWIAQLEEVL